MSRKLSLSLVLNKWSCNHQMKQRFVLTNWYICRKSFKCYKTYSSHSRQQLNTSNRTWNFLQKAVFKQTFIFMMSTGKSNLCTRFIKRPELSFPCDFCSCCCSSNYLFTIVYFTKLFFALFLERLLALVPTS